VAFFAMHLGCLENVPFFSDTSQLDFVSEKFVHTFPHCTFHQFAPPMEVTTPPQALSFFSAHMRLPLGHLASPPHAFTSPQGAAASAAGREGGGELHTLTRATASAFASHGGMTCWVTIAGDSLILYLTAPIAQDPCALIHYNYLLFL
jgi:hypothetical protein